MPSKAINYIMDEKKAEIVSSYALDDSRPYAEQFKETAELYGKGDKFEERKYYHFKQSFAPGEITPGEAHKLAEEMVQKAFPNFECVIATHTDKEHIHSHIIVNAVSFEDGKKMNLRNHEYGQLKDLSNTISQEHGYSVLEWRKPSQERITQEEKHIILKGGTSWKEELKEVLTEGMKQSNSFLEFKNYIEKFDVTIERNTEKTISFKHPQKERAIRGERLGTDFTKGAILDVINQQRNRGISTEQEQSITTITGVEQAQQGRTGEQSTERGFSSIEQELRGLTEGVKQLTSDGRAEQAEREQAAAERVAKSKDRELEANRAVNRISKDVEERKRIAKQQHQNRSRGFGIER